MALRTMRRRPATSSRRWSAKRVDVFFEALKQTGNVLASERAAGMGERSSYSRRQRDPEFRERWVAAIREGYEQLELTALARATNGERKPIMHGGKVVHETTEYSDRLVLWLLAAHRDTVKGDAARRHGEDPEIVRARIREKLRAARRQAAS